MSAGVGVGQTRLATARFTWHDLGTHLEGHRRYDVDRDDLPFDSPVVTKSVTDPCIGGLLVWNRSQDVEGGHIMMLTGQEAWQELVVLNNASWMISCGAVYAASRVGMKSYKAHPDHRIRLGSDTHYVWLLRNERAVEPRAMADTVSLIDQAAAS